MTLSYRLKLTLGLLITSISWLSYSDVFIKVSATIVNPACNITAENGSKKLEVGFNTLNVEQVSAGTISKDFAFYITDCNFAKNLSIVMSPKSTGMVDFNGRRILSTDLPGLGIDFIDSTPGTSPHLLNLLEAERVAPERINDTKYKVSLTAIPRIISSVNPVPVGKFNAAMTIFATYD